jgi:hypothetical protein
VAAQRQWWTIAGKSRSTLVITGIMVVIATVLTWCFVAWQFRYRNVATILEAACVNVGAKIVAGEIADGSARYGTWETHLLPEQIITEINAVAERQRQRVQTSETLTYCAIGLWAAVALIKLLSAR